MDTYATNAPFTSINKCNLDMSTLNDAFPGKIYNAERWDKKNYTRYMKDVNRKCYYCGNQCYFLFGNGGRIINCGVCKKSMLRFELASVNEIFAHR